MKKEVHNNSSHDAGFTLLELLLVVGLTTVLIIGFGRLSTSWANRELADLSGVHMQKIAEATESYIRTTRPTAGGNITNAVLATLPASLINPGPPPRIRNPLRRDVQIQLNIVGTEYQALIYTTGDPIPFDRLFLAARAAGASGGYIENVASPAGAGNTTAISAFGLWTAPTAGLPNLGTFNADGGQLVSYIAFSFEEVFGPYLYRDDLGDPDLNTMFTDLNMNGNDLLAVGNLDANNVDVDQGVNVTGTMNVTGETIFAGSLDIGNVMTVGGQLAVTNDLTVSAGDVVVEGGNIAAASMNVDTANASIVNAPDISATGLTVNGADTVLASDIAITGPVNIVGEIQANTLNTNTLSADEVQSNQMTVTGNVAVQGDLSVTGSAVVDVLAVDDCVRIQPGGVNEQYGPNC